MRRQLARLGRVASLSSVERADLLRAQWALIVARLELRTRRTGELVSRDGDDHDDDRDDDDRDDDTITDAIAGRARALDLAVRRAAAYGPLSTTCLLRATALQRLLEREGILDSRLRVGVRSVDGRFAAHAWVELGGLVLLDQPRHVRSFTSTGLRLVGR